MFGGLLDSAYTTCRCALWVFDIGEFHCSAAWAGSQSHYCCSQFSGSAGKTCCCMSILLIPKTFHSSVSLKLREKPERVSMLITAVSCAIQVTEVTCFTYVDKVQVTLKTIRNNIRKGDLPQHIFIKWRKTAAVFISCSNTSCVLHFSSVFILLVPT